MSSIVFPVAIAVLAVLKGVLEASSIIKTEAFVKLFFLDFKMNTESIDIQRFKRLDIAVSLLVATACVAYVVFNHVAWLLILLPALVILVMMFMLR